MTIHGTPASGGGLFCTVADLEQFLQVEIPAGSQAAAQRAIEEATNAIKAYCRQEIGLVEGDEITLDCAGGTRVFLPELPVTEVTEVIEDGETLVVDDDYKLGQHGILHRIDANWASGVQIVTIAYTHGHATLPGIIVDVATRVAARAYQAGLRAEESEGVPGVASKSLGDYSVAFGSEQSTGAGEAMLGASAAPLLLRSEQRMLDGYRYRPA